MKLFKIKEAQEVKVQKVRTFTQASARTEKTLVKGTANGVAGTGDLALLSYPPHRAGMVSSLVHQARSECNSFFGL